MAEKNKTRNTRPRPIGNSTPHADVQRHLELARLRSLNRSTSIDAVMNTKLQTTPKA